MVRGAAEARGGGGCCVFSFFSVLWGGGGRRVKNEIGLNREIGRTGISWEERLASGALAFFGDKYPEQTVGVVTIPDPGAAGGFYWKELCGGTHVKGVGTLACSRL